MTKETVIRGLEIILNGCDDMPCDDCAFHIKKPAKPCKCGLHEKAVYEAAIALLKQERNKM